MNEIITADRSLEQVTQGILVLSAQTVANICQIGKLLTEAKSMVGHGGWEKYLEEKVSYSQSTANNFMRLYQEYGEFGPNLQTFGNLNPSQALALLALPEGKREEFAEAHDVESMSVRELKAQIAAEKQRADDAEVSAAAIREQLAVAQDEIGAAHQKADDWMKQAHDWQDKAAEDKKTERRLRTDISALEQELASAKAQAGRVDPAELSRIRDEARKDAARVVADSHRRELDEKDETIEKLRAELQQAQEAADSSAARKAVIDLIKEAAAAVGTDLNRLQGYYLKFKDSNPKLSDAIRSLVAQQINMMYSKFDIEPV